MKIKLIIIFSFVFLIIIMFTGMIVRKHESKKVVKQVSKESPFNIKDEIDKHSYELGYFRGVRSTLVYLVETNQIDTSKGLNIDLEHFFNDLDSNLQKDYYGK